MKNKNNISYTGAYLNLSEKEKLKYIDDFKNYLKDNKIGLDIYKELNKISDWNMVFHHLTINLGEIKNKENLGTEHFLVVSGIGIINNDEGKAIALKVSNMNRISEIKVPHITLMVGKDGGKPVDSNKITDWVNFKNNFILQSTIEQFAYGSKVPEKREPRVQTRKEKYYEEYTSGLDGF